MLQRLRDRLRRRRIDAVLSRGDHSRDWTLEDITNPRPRAVEVDPRVVHLAAFLDGFSPERWLVLAESESPNGWPAVWSQWFERDCMNWPEFVQMLLDARLNRHEGISYEHSLIMAEWEQPTDEAFMVQPAPC